MKRLRLQHLESDPTPSGVIVERYRESLSAGGDGNGPALGLVHYRGGEEEFELGVEYSTSADPVDRGVGADILAQLGWEDRTFHGEKDSRRRSLRASRDHRRIDIVSAPSP